MHVSVPYLKGSGFAEQEIKKTVSNTKAEALPADSFKLCLRFLYHS